MVIACGRSGPVNRILSFGPLVLVGRWSYSLYLWHWTIAAIYRLNVGVTSDRVDKLTILGLVFAAGIASYYLVERPAMRAIRIAPPRAWSVVAGGVVALVLVAAGVWGLARTRPADPEIARLDSYLDYRAMPAFTYQFGWHDCSGTAVAPRCLVPRAQGAVVLIAGDSFAAQYRREIAERLPDREVLAAAITGCPALAGAGGTRGACADAWRPVLQFANGGRVSHLILAARWDAAMLPDLAAVLTRLHAQGVHVTVIGPTVEYDGDMPRFMAAARRWNAPGLLARARRTAPFALDRAMAPLVAARGGTYVSQVALECPGGTCRTVTASGAPYHFDFGHLTLPAAREMAARMALGKGLGPRRDEGPRNGQGKEPG